MNSAGGGCEYCGCLSWICFNFISANIWWVSPKTIETFLQYFLDFCRWKSGENKAVGFHVYGKRPNLHRRKVAPLIKLSLFHTKRSPVLLKVYQLFPLNTWNKRFVCMRASTRAASARTHLFLSRQFSLLLWWLWSLTTLYMYRTRCSRDCMCSVLTSDCCPPSPGLASDLRSWNIV